MIFSNDRKLCLSGWLQHNNVKEYDTPLKLQKYLLLYEAFSKVAGEQPDFSHLRGYKRGPVFSHVWGDYTKDREDFNQAAEDIFLTKRHLINENRAKKSAFIVSILSENELSELTHNLNLWKAKKDRIMSGEYQVDLDEKDFNQKDQDLIRMLDQMYPINMIDEVSVIEIDNHYFLFQNDDRKHLTEQHFDTLCMLSANEGLYNPIYVEIDDKGRLIID